MSQSLPKRPLSPHLSIYRPQISSVLSISHRATGIINAAGSLLLLAWVWAAAYDAEMFECISECASSTIGQLLLIGWTFTLFYHLANGIRHLFWDAGYGFTIPVMTRSGWCVVIAAIAATAFTWMCIPG
jgi:succinate dehydrogenase / fumarate reductase cytochrome b subunit